MFFWFCCYVQGPDQFSGVCAVIDKVLIGFLVCVWCYWQGVDWCSCGFAVIYKVLIGFRVVLLLFTRF